MIFNTLQYFSEVYGMRYYAEIAYRTKQLHVT